MLAPLDTLGVVAAAIVGWSLICLGIAAIGGWMQLARVYPARGDGLGRRWWMQSARLRFGLAYNNCLVVDADPSGLRIAILLPFRVGHPPIFLPWSELCVSRRRQWLVRVVRLEPARLPAVPITISERLYARLEAAVGPAAAAASEGR